MGWNPFETVSSVASAVMSRTVGTRHAVLDRPAEKTVAIGELRESTIRDAARDQQILALTNRRELIGIVIPVGERFLSHVLESNISRIHKNILEGNQQLRAGRGGSRSSSTRRRVTRSHRVSRDAASPLHDGHGTSMWLALVRRLITKLANRRLFWGSRVLSAANARRAWSAASPGSTTSSQSMSAPYRWSAISRLYLFSSSRALWSNRGSPQSKER